jgi:hypothetical protein
MGNTPSQSEILDEELKKLRRTFNKGRIRGGPEWDVFGTTRHYALEIRKDMSGPEAYETFINNQQIFNQWKDWFETNQMIKMMGDTSIARKTDTGDVDELSAMFGEKRGFGDDIKDKIPKRSKKSKMAYRYLSMPQKAKKLPCNRPSKSYKPEKKRMVRACANGKEKLIHFGATGYKHNYSPKARANFRARHRCDTAKDKLTARYWACKNLWTKGGDKLTKADKSRRAPSDRRRKSTKKRRKSTKKRRKSTKKRRKSTKKRRKSTKKRRKSTKKRRKSTKKRRKSTKKRRKSTKKRR